MATALPRRVAQLIGMSEAIPFSRGSAGLYALLAAVRSRYGPGEVVVPALCCETVALAAAYAGHQLRFADVSAETLCVTEQSLTPLVSSKTRAVIIVHLFGIDAGINQFSSLRAKYPHVVFVEDVAHALGGRDSSGRLLGNGLDATLLSFSDSKVVPGNGGMLLLSTNTFSNAEIIASIPDGAPVVPDPYLALSLRNMVHALWDLWRIRPSIKTAGAFLSVQNAYQDLIVLKGGISAEHALDKALDRIEESRAVRFGRYARYREAIGSRFARVVRIREGCNCWRCPVIFDTPAQARKVTELLRHSGVHASNHYYPLNLLFGDEHAQVSESIASRIVNLWVDDLATGEMMDRAIEIINLN